MVPGDVSAALQPRETKERSSIEGCDAPEYCKGLCEKHYYRDLRHGSPYAVMGNGRAKLTEVDVERCGRPGSS
jgi:hypothetical protein